MPASEFQKKALSFAAIFAITAALLATLPLVETWLQMNFLPQFGLRFTFESNWQLAAESADITTLAPMAPAWARAAVGCVDLGDRFAVLVDPAQLIVPFQAIAA